MVSKYRSNECSKRHLEVCKGRNVICFQCGGKGHYENECQSRSEEDEEGPTQTRIAFHPVQPSRGGSHLDKGKEIVLG